MLPPGTTFVGTAYRFSTSVANPPLVGPQAAVSFGYLGAEVPAGEEDGIRVYYYDGSGGAGWQLLSDTRLDTYHNLASARYRGPGIYALMSSLVVPLVPGWSNIGYPAPVARSAPDTMASVAGQYSVVYHYNPANTGDPWEVYSPAAPDWVNNLHCMAFGQGYWVYSTSPTTATLRIRSASDPGEVTGCESAARDNPTTLALSEAATPPATFYGTIAASPSLAVAPGLPVVAWVNGAICGQGVTQAHDGQVAYIVRVAAANTAAPDCGRTGSLVRFTVAGRPSGEAQWRSESVQSVDLLPEDNKVFLPLVWR
jgi:hypothetical protein